MGERRCGFSTFNLLTQAASDRRERHAGADHRAPVRHGIPALATANPGFSLLQDEKINVALHYNKQSGKEPLLKEIIETVIQAFKA